MMHTADTALGLTLQLSLDRSLLGFVKGLGMCEKTSTFIQLESKEVAMHVRPQERCANKMRQFQTFQLGLVNELEVLIRIHTTASNIGHIRHFNFIRDVVDKAAPARRWT